MLLGGKVRRFWNDELGRADSREEALARLAPLNHATRLLHSLHRTLAELLLLDRLDELLEAHGAEQAPERPPLLTELAGEGDLHVVSVHGRRAVRSTIWSGSGDAELNVCDPGETPSEGVALREWLDLLEDYVGAVVDYLDADRNPRLSRTGSRL